MTRERRRLERLIEQVGYAPGDFVDDMPMLEALAPLIEQRATRSALDGLARWVERIEDGVPPLQRTGMVWISEVAREARARGRKR